MVTLSVIKADVGGFVGHSHFHPEILEKAKEVLSESEKLIDFKVTRCGDDLELIMTHRKGENNQEIHSLAWKTFKKTTEKAKDLKLYGAGQDLLKETFSGNLKGMGPGICELSFQERESEPLIVFMADKTEPGAWNLPLYKIFADPFNTAGLIIDPALHGGFKFEVHDVLKSKKILFNAPNELYDLLAFIGQPGRYVIKKVYRREDNEPVASTSTQRLNIMAGHYVGKDDPAMIVRAQHNFPAVGEILEPFAFPHLVKGWMRGSHNGPLIPVKGENAHPTRFDGPPRVMALGFQLRNGKLGKTADMFDDPVFDQTRQKASEEADFLRRHGPFEPHRLSEKEMEYTTLPDIREKLEDRFKKLEE